MVVEFVLWHIPAATAKAIYIAKDIRCPHHWHITCRSTRVVPLSTLVTQALQEDFTHSL